MRFAEPAPVRRIPTPLLFGVFVLSGISALLYQMIWQRGLLTLYGSNVESVAMVVSAFMLGLGLGSLAGGWVSKHTRLPLVVVFAVAELGIGLYGLASLRFFAWVGEVTVGAGTWQTGLLAFGLLLLPTLLMGATLPLLVAHQVNTTKAVGRAVSWLYFVNTLGAAFGAFLAAFVVLRHLGQSGSVRLAAVLNGVVALTILAVWMGRKRAAEIDERNESDEGHESMEGAADPERAGARPSPSDAEWDGAFDAGFPSAAPSAVRTLTFRRALMVAALSGFLALSWEILWARLYNYVTASRAPAFGAMLGSYLLGLALGSLLSMRWQKDDAQRSVRSLAWLIFGANALAFLVVPLAARMVVAWPEHLYLAGGIDLASWLWTLPLVILASAIQGTVLPLLCHIAIPASQSVGQRLSYVYLANIVGSGAGSLLTGFVLMEFWSLQVLGPFLLALALGLWWVLRGGANLDREALGAVALFVALVGGFASSQSGLWERLYFKQAFSGQRFPFTVESRHGVVNVDTGNTVYGNGAYDGMIGTSLKRGDWHVRPYFLSAVHPDPKRILVVGMSAGAWTQIMANHPQVEQVDVVEISEAYLKVVDHFPEVRSILTNPKVRIHIDDGRRWLKRNRHATFDAIVMNTTHHWREFASSLLSVEFLSLTRAHLAPGGIVLWNCTSSGRAAKTGMEVFPHTMMCLNNCIGSLEPIRVDKERWRRVLGEYRIDGHPVFDLGSTAGRAELDSVLALCDTDIDPPSDDLPARDRWWIVGPERMRRLWSREIPITDDNLGHEYR